jgi:hypothetical protein
MGPIQEVSELQEYSRENYVLEYTMCPETSLDPSGICAAPLRRSWDAQVAAWEEHSKLVTVWSHSSST